MISVGFNPVSQTVGAEKEKEERKLYTASRPETEGFKNITGGQIKDILATPQVNRSDCYLVSTLKALAKSGFGKQMLKKSIKTSKDGDTFEIQFKKYDGKNSYKVADDSLYEGVTDRTRFNPTGAVESAANFLYQEKFSSKPLYIRAYSGIMVDRLPMEYNVASYCMENLTGKKPISIGDESLMSLSHKKEEAVALLDRIGELPINRHSFVAGSKLSGTKDNIGTMHYYVLKKVDKDKKEVHLVNPRYVDLEKGNAKQEFEEDLKLAEATPEEILSCVEDVKNMPKVYKLSYEQFLKNFRSIVGYFDEKVEKNK